jgi:hypothetical protein
VELFGLNIGKNPLIYNRLRYSYLSHEIFSNRISSLFGWTLWNIGNLPEHSLVEVVNLPKFEKHALSSRFLKNEAG